MARPATASTEYWREKVVLITGASRGLGRAIAWAAGRAGSRLALVARDADALEEFAAELLAEGCEALPLAADITSQEDVDRLMPLVIERFGRLDALVNCAGRSDRGEVLATPPERFQELLELNFLAAVRCTQAAAPHLLATRGHIVQIGSLAAKVGSRYLGAYPASKFPLAGYSQQLRLELKDHGVHVLLVCPGPIAREDAGSRYDDLAGSLPESARRPGGGVKLKGLDPHQLAQQILTACQQRRPELVLPRSARLLFALGQLWPTLGDRLLERMTGGRK